MNLYFTCIHQQERKEVQLAQKCAQCMEKVSLKLKFAMQSESTYEKVKNWQDPQNTQAVSKIIFLNLLLNWA